MVLKIQITKDIENIVQEKYKKLENLWELNQAIKLNSLKKILLNKNLMIIKFYKQHYLIVKDIGHNQIKQNLILKEKLHKNQELDFFPLKN